MSTSSPEFVFHNLPSTYIVTVLRAREASSFDKINMLCCPKYIDSLYLASRGVRRAQICQHTLKIVTGLKKLALLLIPLRRYKLMLFLKAFLACYAKIWLRLLLNRFM